MLAAYTKHWGKTQRESSGNVPLEQWYFIVVDMDSDIIYIPQAIYVCIPLFHFNILLAKRVAVCYVCVRALPRCVHNYIISSLLLMDFSYHFIKISMYSDIIITEWIFIVAAMHVINSRPICSVECDTTILIKLT